MATGKVASLMEVCKKYVYENNMSSTEVEKFLYEFEDIKAEIEAVEEKEYLENWEEDPASVVARENCEAFM